MKNEWNRIKLFFRNVWMILAVDLPHKVIFSFSCAVTALFEIGGLLHSFSMAQIGRTTDIWSMIAAATV